MEAPQKAGGADSNYSCSLTILCNLKAISTTYPFGALLIVLTLIIGCSSKQPTKSTKPASLTERMDRETELTERSLLGQKALIRRTHNQILAESKTLNGTAMHVAGRCLQEQRDDTGILIIEHDCADRDLTFRKISETALRAKYSADSLTRIQISQDGGWIALLLQKSGSIGGKIVLMDESGESFIPAGLEMVNDQVFDLSWDDAGDLYIISLIDERPIGFYRYSPARDMMDSLSPILGTESYLLFKSQESAEKCLVSHPDGRKIRCFPSEERPRSAKVADRNYWDSRSIVREERSIYSPEGLIRITSYRHGQSPQKSPTIFRFYGAYDTPLNDELDPELIPLLRAGYSMSFLHVPLQSNLKGRSAGTFRCTQLSLLTSAIRAEIKNGFATARGNILWLRSAANYLALPLADKIKSEISSIIMEAPFINPYQRLDTLRYEKHEWGDLAEKSTQDCVNQLEYAQFSIGRQHPILVVASQFDESIPISGILDQIADLREDSEVPIRLLITSAPNHTSEARSPDEHSWNLAKILAFISQSGSNRAPTPPSY